MVKCLNTDLYWNFMLMYVCSIVIDVYISHSLEGTAITFYRFDKVANYKTLHR
jgi:hypothetical protein